MRDRIDEILAFHTGKTKEEIHRDTERDRILGAKEAVEYGIADRVMMRRRAGPGISRPGRRSRSRVFGTPCYVGEDTREPRRPGRQARFSQGHGRARRTWRGNTPVRAPCSTRARVDRGRDRS